MEQLDNLIAMIVLGPLFLTVLGYGICWAKNPHKCIQSLERMFRPVLRNDKGQDLIEYALFAGFVAFVILMIFLNFRDNNSLAKKEIDAEYNTCVSKNRNNPKLIAECWQKREEHIGLLRREVAK